MPIVCDFDLADVIGPCLISLSLEQSYPATPDVLYRVAQPIGRNVWNGERYHEHGSLLVSERTGDRRDTLRDADGFAPRAAGAEPDAAEKADIQLALGAVVVFEENEVIPAMSKSAALRVG